MKTSKLKVFEFSLLTLRCVCAKNDLLMNAMNCHPWLRYCICIDHGFHSVSCIGVHGGGPGVFHLWSDALLLLLKSIFLEGVLPLAERKVRSISQPAKEELDWTAKKRNCLYRPHNLDFTLELLAKESFLFAFLFNYQNKLFSRLKRK